MNQPNQTNLKLKNSHLPDLTSIKPRFFNLNSSGEYEEFQELLNQNPGVKVHDNLESQIKELHKIRYPEHKFTKDQLNKHFEEWKQSNDPFKHGLWVYYPWNSNVVHVLDRDEFIELRTSRNKYKITEEEQKLLSQKTVGVIGLSVGQSVAVTMAIERTFGTLRIADFDDIELTNLNRIRTGLHSISMKKTTIVCREIAEIDPFLQVEVFDDGITEENIDDFLIGNGKLDLLIEECDSLDIKILSRLHAREHQIPVLMDTSDRGMIDIERFDLEPDREILHGRVKIDNINSLKGLPYEEKIPMILDMVGVDQMSKRLKSSMIEIGQTLTTWPQLVSEVTLGGALCTSIARSILLGKPVKSGRFYIDPSEKYLEEDVEYANGSHMPSVSEKDEQLADAYRKDGSTNISEEQRRELVYMGSLAPSAGNLQPWKIIYCNGTFYLFLKEEYSGFLGDYQFQASYMAMGSLIENMLLKAGEMGNKLAVDYFPAEDEPKFIGRVRVEATEAEVFTDPLAKFIEERHTNRNTTEHKEIPQEFLNELDELLNDFPGFAVHFLADQKRRKQAAELIGRADRLRMMSKEGHGGFFNEIRWNDEDAKKTGDGIDIETVDIAPSDLAGFRIASDWKAVELLSRLDLGNAFTELSKEPIDKSDGILLISYPEFNKHSLVLAGRVIERVWLLCTKFKLGVQPLLSTCLFYNTFHFGGKHFLFDMAQRELADMEDEYHELFPDLKRTDAQMFLFRMSGMDAPYKKAYRRDLETFYKEI